MIKNNDTSYVIVLAIEALGIAIDFVTLVLNMKLKIWVAILIILMSILLPIIIILLEKKNINIFLRLKTIRADIYIAFGNYKSAKDILISIEEKYPQNYDVHKKLAKIYEKEGGIRKAVDEYVQCIDINKQDYDSYYKVANFLIDLDRKQESIEMLNKLLTKKPDYTDASMVLADLLIEKEEYKEAAMVYMDALKYNPVSYELNYNLGIVYTMLNDFKNAKACYEKAAELNYLAYNAKYYLAEIALIYKDLDKAELYFEQALSDEDLSADCYFELSKINLMRGKKDIALKYINIAIDLNSKKIVAKIEKEPLFMTIRSKISIPFNLEEKEISGKYSKKEIKAKEHLENTTDITTNMGYGPIQNELDEEKKQENERQKE